MNYSNADMQTILKLLLYAFYSRLIVRNITFFKFVKLLKIFIPFSAPGQGQLFRISNLKRHGVFTLII